MHSNSSEASKRDEIILETRQETIEVIEDIEDFDDFLTSMTDGDSMKSLSPDPIMPIEADQEISGHGQMNLKRDLLKHLDDQLQDKNEHEESAYGSESLTLEQAAPDGSPNEDENEHLEENRKLESGKSSSDHKIDKATETLAYEIMESDSEAEKDQVENYVADLSVAITEKRPNIAEAENVSQVLDFKKEQDNALEENHIENEPINKQETQDDITSNHQNLIEPLENLGNEELETGIDDSPKILPNNLSAQNVKDNLYPTDDVSFKDEFIPQQKPNEVIDREKQEESKLVDVQETKEEDPSKESRDEVPSEPNILTQIDETKIEKSEFIEDKHKYKYDLTQSFPQIKSPGSKPLIIHTSIKSPRQVKETLENAGKSDTERGRRKKKKVRTEEERKEIWDRLWGVKSSKSRSPDPKGQAVLEEKEYNLSRNKGGNARAITEKNEGKSKALVQKQSDLPNTEREHLNMKKISDSSPREEDHKGKDTNVNHLHDDQVQNEEQNDEEVKLVEVHYQNEVGIERFLNDTLRHNERDEHISRGHESPDDYVRSVEDDYAKDDFEEDNELMTIVEENSSDVASKANSMRHTEDGRSEEIKTANEYTITEQRNEGSLTSQGVNEHNDEKAQNLKNSDESKELERNETDAEPEQSLFSEKMKRIRQKMLKRPQMMFDPNSMMEVSQSSVEAEAVVEEIMEEASAEKAETSKVQEQEIPRSRIKKLRKRVKMSKDRKDFAHIVDKAVHEQSDLTESKSEVVLASQNDFSEQIHAGSPKRKLSNSKELVDRSRELINRKESQRTESTQKLSHSPSVSGPSDSGPDSPRHLRRENGRSISHSPDHHQFSALDKEEIVVDARRKICTNLRETLDDLKLNKKGPYFFRDKTTAYYGLVHSALFGSERVQSAEADHILGVSKETVEQLRKYETDREKIERKLAAIAAESGGGNHLRHGRIGLQNQEKSFGTPKSPKPRVKELKEQFRAFAKFGDRHSDGSQITLSRCDKWLRQAGIIDEKILTTTDTAILFRKMSKSHIWMSFKEWQKFLKHLAAIKNLDLKLIQNALVSCGPPEVDKTALLNEHSLLLQRLTDVSMYGGTHRNRFDQSGKGKGIYGRRDIQDLLPVWLNLKPSSEGLMATTPKTMTDIMHGNKKIR